MADVVIQPTVDLAALYQDVGDAAEVADFVKIQALLSDRRRATPHLRRLEEALATAASSVADPGPTPAARAAWANQLLSEVLQSREEAHHFVTERPVLVGFASADDFRLLTSEGRPFYDVGAGLWHGEMSHRIQWFIVMSAAEDGLFTRTPRQLYSASLKADYRVDVPGGTGSAYAWDWIVDRVRGLRPTRTDIRASDYDGKVDAWTHPGDEGTAGSLSHDIYHGAVDGIPTLRAIRTAQIEGNKTHDDRLRRWFDFARSIGVAEGRSPVMPGATTREPTYFYMPSPAAITRLGTAKQSYRNAFAAIVAWTTGASIDRLGELYRGLKPIRTTAMAGLGGKEVQFVRGVLDAWSAELVDDMGTGVVSMVGEQGRAPDTLVNTLRLRVGAIQASNAWLFQLD